MKYNDVRNNLVNTICAIRKEIYSLDETSQDQIFNEDIIPEEPELLFLKNSYFCLNEILLNVNSL